MAITIGKVSLETKKYLIMLLYDCFGGATTPEIHKKTKQLQGILVEKYGVTMDYMFSGPSINLVWSNELQSDIERYESLGMILENDPAKLTELGYFIMKTTMQQNLGKHFGPEFIQNIKNYLLTAPEIGED